MISLSHSVSSALALVSWACADLRESSAYAELNPGFTWAWPFPNDDPGIHPSLQRLGPKIQTWKGIRIPFVFFPILSYAPLGIFSELEFACR